MKRISWLEIAGHLAFWLLTTWVVTQLFSIERYEIEAIDGREEITITKFWGFTRFLLVGQLLRLVFFYGYLRLLRPWTTGAGRFPSLAGKAVILLLICLGLEGGFWLLYPPREPEAFPWLLVGGLYGFYWATATAYGFVQAWIRQSAARQALDLEKKKAELALLRSQLQPHFLFNTLNNLLAMVDQRTHPALADGFERLSDLLRYVVYETEQERVPLARELDFVRNYAELALLRFEETEVDFALEVEGPVEQHWIAPGLLAPLVENAFKHGTAPEARACIRILVVAGAGSKVSVAVKNALVDPAPEKPGPGGVGLVNLRERLARLYPDRHQLDICQTDQSYSITLTLDPHESDHRG